jgi:hypothetical protein
MIPGARRYLRRLSEEGARIRIITHRLAIRYFHNGAVTQTYRVARPPRILLGPLLRRAAREHL